MKKWLLVILCCATFCGCRKKTQPVVKKDPVAQRAPGSVAFDSSAVLKFEDQQLTDFYRQLQFRTFWVTQQSRKTAQKILAASEAEGLDPNDYFVKEIGKFEKKFQKLSDAELLTYDILLTQSLRKYLTHLAGGKLDPYHIYPDWDLRRNEIEVNASLVSGVKGDSLEIVVERLKPNHLVYRRLKKALAYLNSFGKEQPERLMIAEKIVRGDSLPAVVGIKKHLMYWRDLARSDSISAVYDDRAVAAMRRFQLRHGLVPDGVVGKGTVEALNVTKEARKQQLIVNLERWRWFPRELGKQYVIVNIPEYKLRVVKDGDTVDTRRVVVGKSERRTPVLTSTFTDVILNPTWTVPPTILKEDLGPGAAKDTAYFTKRRLTIYNYKNEIVPPSQWNAAKPNNYRYVQSPGDDNSLGNVKFNFRNRFTVYLHDTNHRDYFSRNYRSLSSGCVRVQNPLPLAEYLINDARNWNLEKINEVVATKETTYIKLKDKTNIYQLYWTAWMNKRGELEFRPDIYHLDADLYKRLRQ